MRRFRVAMAAGERPGSLAVSMDRSGLPFQAFAAIGGSTANQRRLARYLAIG